MQFASEMKQTTDPSVYRGERRLSERSPRRVEAGRGDGTANDMATMLGEERVFDETLFARHMNTHKGTVFRLAYGYLRNKADAEDVVQNVFMKLYRAMCADDPMCKDDERVKRWVVRVTVNECTSLYRALRRRPESIDDYIETLAAPDVPDSGEQADLAKDLAKKVLRLPARYRDVVYLYYYEGYSTREVAEALGVPEATARTRLARGRRRLKDILTKEGDGR